MMHFLLVAVLLGTAITATAKDFEVTQKDKKFNEKALTIKVGDSVSFKNDDAVPHNVFSLSDAKTFDLGSYPQGQSRKITFDKPGEVEIECSIHSEMKLMIHVQK